MYYFFFFNDTATTEIYTLSLHDALPISTTSSAWWSTRPWPSSPRWGRACGGRRGSRPACSADRKSTRLNSSHGYISYAVFCLKKKKKDKAHSHQKKCSTHKCASRQTTLT